MTKRKRELKKYGWLAGLTALMCVQLVVIIYYGGQKAGYHEDEYYSYYSTNRTAGLFEPDREWVERDSLLDEFIVRPGEGFNYRQVALVQSWDVHPPFYYFLLHTACSLFPGVFSKWLGIGVNLLAFAVNFWLLAYLAYRLSGGSRPLTVLICGLSGFNSVIISGVIFIRMYEWLTLFVLSCAALFTAQLRREKREDTVKLSAAKFLLPLMAVNYLGFLTQYYYILFLFFASAFYCMLLLRQKSWKGLLQYAVCTGLSLLAAVVSYPASLTHIFRGYRGREAAAEFLNVSNTWERLRFFFGLMNEYVFDNAFWLLLLVIAGLFCLNLFLRRRAGGSRPAVFGREYFLLLTAASGYYLAVSQTALLLQETSNRYELPVYGILMLLMVIALFELGREALSFLPAGPRLTTLSLAALTVFLFALDFHELSQGRVIFLYREDAAKVEYAREHSDIPAVVLYNDATPYNVWRCTDELLEYPRLYFADEGNRDPISDGTITGSDALVVYAADHENREESLRLLLMGNPEFSGYRQVYEEEIWSVYEFY